MSALTAPSPDVLFARAKLNLVLEITARRPDGFHELSTLFFPLDEPRDTLTISPAPAGTGLILDCPGLGLSPEKNLVHKAWVAFGQATGYRPDLDVRLDKSIPEGAGLGGGSSDAAAMLRFLNRTTPQPLDPAALNSLAADLGADVPFFLMDGPAWATGIGENLTPARVDFSGLTLVLACPPVRVDTAWAYREWDRLADQTAREGSRSADFLTSLRAGSTNHAPAGPVILRNDFEAVVFPAHPELRRLKAGLYSLGANAAAMSGSGASVFALFRQAGQARDAVSRLGGQGMRVFGHAFDETTTMPVDNAGVSPSW